MIETIDKFFCYESDKLYKLRYGNKNVDEEKTIDGIYAGILQSKYRSKKSVDHVFWGIDEYNRIIRFTKSFYIQSGNTPPEPADHGDTQYHGIPLVHVNIDPPQGPLSDAQIDSLKKKIYDLKEKQVKS